MQHGNPVTTLEQFAHLMHSWFFHKSAQLDQLIAFPTHEPIRVTDNTTGEERVLEGAEREAFIDGLKVARTVFDSLPFAAVPVEGAEVEPTNG